jgi:outer membrane protein assembly factor BamB
MKHMRASGWIAVTLLLAGCGGGGGGVAAPPPPPPPAPSALLTSGPVILMGNQGSNLSTTLTLTLNFTPAGTFSVQISNGNDPTSLPFDLSVQPAAGGPTQYTAQLAVSNSAFSDFYSGTATLLLCADVNCLTYQVVPSIAVPYVVDVLPAGSTWPGNNLTALSAWSGVPDWTTFQGNAAHTGFVPVTIDSTVITSRWRIMGTGDVISGYNNYPQTITAAAGAFYQSGPTTVYARSEFDGSLLWQHTFTTGELQFPSANPPAIYGNTVYVQAGQQSSTFLYAFDSATGNRLFRSPMTSQWEFYLAPTMGPSGIYQGGGTYGGLYGFSASSGAQLFYQPIAGGVSLWTPAVDANGVYYYGQGQMLAFDPVSGALNTTIIDPSGSESGDEIVGSPVIGAPGMVYAGTYEDSLIDGGTLLNTLTAYNVPGGVIAWQLTGNYPTNPAYNAGHLYVPNQNPYQIESHAETDGSLEWAWTPPPAAGTHFISEVLLTNNLFFVSTDTTTYAVDLATRQIQWSFPMSGHLALSSNGVLYIQNRLLICAFNVK